MKNDGKLKLTAACNITASKPVDGQEAKLPTFDMVAYNGGKMTVSSWGDVVVDLAGMQVSDETPILYGHENWSLSSVLGQTSQIEKGNSLKASGTIMGDSETTKQILSLAKNGFKFQASIGASVLKYEEVEAGESREINGQTIEGPFTLAVKSKLDEISVVPLGADSTTRTDIAAQKKEENKQEKKTMEKKVEGQNAPTAEQIRAEAVTEQNRILRVQDVAKEYPEISAKATKEGWDESKTQMEVLKAENAKLQAQIEADKAADKRPNPANINAGAMPKLTASIVEAAVAIRAGLKKPEKAYSDDVLNRADDMKINSITDLVKASLAVSGKKLEVSRHETRDFLQAAFSTRDVANILSNLANKFIMQGYGTVEDTWRKVAGIRSVVDFKQNTGNRLIMTNLLQALAPGGEISHGSLSDETRTVQADTKALMLGLTRQDIINDDLGMFIDLTNRFGFVSARTFNTDFWAVLNAATAQFTNERGNLTTGALSLERLKVAEKLFMEQTDADGNPIGSEATSLLVSPTNSATARELYVSTNLTAGGSKNNVAKNIYEGMFEPAVSRYLSANPWYLVSSPMAMPLMQVAFLNGRQEPFIESSDADFNTLGIQMRCWYDYGVSFGEYRAAVRSTGE